MSPLRCRWVVIRLKPWNATSPALCMNMLAFSSLIFSRAAFSIVQVANTLTFPPVTGLTPVGIREGDINNRCLVCTLSRFAVVLLHLGDQAAKNVKDEQR